MKKKMERGRKQENEGENGEWKRGSREEEGQKNEGGKGFKGCGKEKKN